MTKARELERLLRRVEDLYVGEADVPAETQVEGLPTKGMFEGLPARCIPELDPEGEELVAAVLASLRRIAVAVAQEARLPPPPPTALRAALGGAEVGMRGELLTGRRATIPNLLPAFIYIATVPFLDREEALRRSDEVRRIVEGEGWRLDR